MPGDESDALFHDAAAATGDMAIGIAAARKLAPGSLGLLDYALFTGETWGEAIRRVAQFYAVATERVGMAIEEHGDEAHLVLRHHAVYRSNRHWIEFSFAVIVERARQAMGTSFRLRGVDFAHDAPAGDAGHERYFAAPVRWSQPFDRLVFDRALLAVQLQTGAIALAEALERRLAELVPATLDSTMVGVRDAIARGIDAGDVTLDTVAERLGTSTRSLQRTLREHDTSFKELLDEMRRDRALVLLRASEMTVAEVGRRVGFSDPTAFFRAFRRWTGSTPASQRGEPDD